MTDELPIMDEVRLRLRDQGKTPAQINTMLRHYREVNNLANFIADSRRRAKHIGPGLY